MPIASNMPIASLMLGCPPHFLLRFLRNRGRKQLNSNDKVCLVATVCASKGGDPLGITNGTSYLIPIASNMRQPTASLLMPIASLIPIASLMLGCPPHFSLRFLRNRGHKQPNSNDKACLVATVCASKGGDPLGITNGTSYLIPIASNMRQPTASLLMPIA
jgi:hypothetical protein